ncbi:MAG: hypothetical protein KAI17_22230, partial [Thiotrichaceae bacterium]|nr:hypothetical protein [Thiotrichaceae bacterium]
YACADIKKLYANGEVEKILQGYYFNSWCGATGSQDRLLHLLKGVDIACGSDVRLDRGLDFLGLKAVDWMQFEQRGDYEYRLLDNKHQALPVDTSLTESHNRYRQHQHLVGLLRRRAYFERRGEDWKNLVFYRSAQTLLGYLNGNTLLEDAKQQIVFAINRGEGLHKPDFFNGQLAMQIRKVAKGTIKSYRVFPEDVFTIKIKDEAMNSEFVEHNPLAMILSYRDNHGLMAELEINLDLFELLQRLNQGYVPSAEVLQGYYLSLSVFKNVLASAPYQEVLLTTDGRHYQKIIRKDDGVLALRELTVGANV